MKIIDTAVVLWLCNTDETTVIYPLIKIFHNTHTMLHIIIYSLSIKLADGTARRDYYNY